MQLVTIKAGIETNGPGWTRVFVAIGDARVSRVFFGPGHDDRAGRWLDRMEAHVRRTTGRADTFINALRAAGVPPTVIHSAMEEACA